MLNTIVGAFLPSLITICLGYVAARHHQFKATEAPTLTRMVMTYALPIAIFVGTVSTSRAALISDLPLLIALALAIIGLYCVVFAACRFLLHWPPAISALLALSASAPNAPFFGTSVVGYVFGNSGAIPVALGSVLINITVVPLTVILMSLNTEGNAVRPRRVSPVPSHALSIVAAAPSPSETAGRIFGALKAPIVWLPVLGFLMALSGISTPALITNSLGLLAHSASGVALFASGIILAGYTVTIDRTVLSLVFMKNVLQPTLVWVRMVALGVRHPILGQAVVTAALPMTTIIVILAVSYNVAKTVVSSALFTSTVASPVTIAIFIALTGA